MSNFAVAYKMKKKTTREMPEIESSEIAGKGSESSEQEPEIDLVDCAMKKRYSKGGVVSNESEDLADEDPNEFDDEVLDDHLTAHEPANEGELGDKQEDEDRHDIVAKLMRLRSKKA